MSNIFQTINLNANFGLELYNTFPIFILKHLRCVLHKENTLYMKTLIFNIY